MPGHKGREVVGCEKYDITEIEGADVLYSSGGIIRESENIASELFGSARTVYSAEGSSLAIRAMVYMIKLYASSHGKEAVIAAGRNAHKTFITATALCGVETEWMYGENAGSVLSCSISPQYLDSFLGGLKKKPAAVYVTSPDYTGNITDINALSQICKKHGVLLLVDNAHGAYFRFLAQDIHPITLGADMCCDSAHKTLRVITGGAYLHIGASAPEEFAQMAENAMSIFASTSPSYLILQSLDAANAYLAESFRTELADLCRLTDELRAELLSAGYTLCGNEPTKLTISPKSYGYTGEELAAILRLEGAECEFADPDYTVMMLTPQTPEADVRKAIRLLTSLPKRNKITALAPAPCKNPVRLTAREALFAPCEELEADKCKGRILASPTVSCPPAVPIAVCGEEIGESAIECFRYYGIRTCRVVKNQSQR